MAKTDLLRSLRDGSAAREVRLAAARGLAPLSPGESLDVLVCLAADPDRLVASQARATLKTIPADELIPQLQQRECGVRTLEYFAGADYPEKVLEAIVLNPGTPAAAIANVASTASAPLLETILYNRARLIEFPEIIRKAKENPRLSADARRTIQEIESEFFRRGESSYSVGEAAAPAVPAGLEPAEEAAPEDISLEGLPLDPEERDIALQQRLGRMTARQKIWQALMGTREVRAVLIRDPDKAVCRTVLQSPKLSDSEIEAFAAMRSVSEDILREIGNSREWTRSYAVVHNLVKNPKTPPSISQRMLFRLQSKDLMILAKDRAVPEVVRRNAQNTLKQRSDSRTSL